IAALAGEYTTDSSSKNSGGLYENVTKGQFVEPYNTWLFDETRKEGDYDLIETEYGWHIVYFISAGEPQWKGTIASNLRNDAYESFKEEAAEKYPVTVNDDLINVDA
ncbi:MAG: peptidylprolyl isomerase, partial [Clostridia bacterium]|nr:peptidylprolyl isomerase [Clostridia bacterium]